MIPLQVDTAGAAVLTVLARVLGLAALAALVAAFVALGYRWYVRERVPRGLALLAGLAVVAAVLNTTSLLAAAIAPSGASVELVAGLVNVTTFAAAAASAYGGLRLGDRLGTDLSAATGSRSVEGDVGEFVKSVGRVITVTLPEDVEDVVGYDPVPEATKETLAGRRFVFPRRLTREELRDRLVSRLKTDYGVGHVDVDLGPDGSVEYLALGARAAGIGPTLPPATNAVAIRADPAHAASAGDVVQVWETDPMRRVLTGELRGVAGDVVTVAIDAADTPKLDPSERYKLVTLPVEDRPDREFASLLRAADETLATVTLEPGSDLVGARVGDLDVTVGALTREDAPPEPLPATDRTLESGDVVYAVAKPEALRALEARAGGTGEPSPEAPEPGDSGDASATAESVTAETTAVGAGSEEGSTAAEPDESPGTDGQGTETVAPAEGGETGDSTEGEDASAPPTEDVGADSTGTSAERDGEPPSDPEAGEDGGGFFPDTSDLPGLDVDEAAPDLDEAADEPEGWKHPAADLAGDDQPGEAEPDLDDVLGDDDAERD